GLALAGRALDALPEVAEQGALARALAKLEAVLPADQLDRVHELAGKVSVDLEGDPAETTSRTELARAAATGHRVEIEYWSASRGELTRRKVDPWLVFSASGHWYLSGWCHKAVAERLFRVDRVVSVRPTDEPFERPAGFDPAAHRELGWCGAAGPGSRSSARPASPRPPTVSWAGPSCSPAAWSASSTFTPRPSGWPTTSPSWTPSAAPTAACGSAWPPTSSPRWADWSCAWAPPPTPLQRPPPPPARPARPRPGPPTPRRCPRPRCAAPSPRPPAWPWPPTPPRAPGRPT